MIDAAMKLLYIRDPKTGEFKPLAAIRGPQGPKGDSDGRNAWIRFSANSDGSAFTSTWTAGQNYVGFASSITEPTDKADYVWVNLAQIVKSFITNDAGTDTELVMSQAKVTTLYEGIVRRLDSQEQQITDLDGRLTQIELGH